MAFIDDILDVTELEDSDDKDKMRKFLEVQARINQDIALKLTVLEAGLKALTEAFHGYKAASEHWRDVPKNTITY